MYHNLLMAIKIRLPGKIAGFRFFILTKFLD